MLKKMRDPISAVTHLASAVAALVGMLVLMQGYGQAAHGQAGYGQTSYPSQQQPSPAQGFGQSYPSPPQSPSEDPLARSRDTSGARAYQSVSHQR